MIAPPRRAGNGNHRQLKPPSRRQPAGVLRGEGIASPRQYGYHTIPQFLCLGFLVDDRGLAGLYVIVCDSQARVKRGPLPEGKIGPSLIDLEDHTIRIQYRHGVG